MKKKEVVSLLVCSIILGFIFSFQKWGFEDFSASEGLGNWFSLSIISLIGLLVHYLGIVIFARKYSVSSEFKLWTTSKKTITSFFKFLQPVLPNKIYSGIIVPLLFAFFSNGFLKLPLVGVTELKEDPSKLLKLKHKYLTEYKQGLIHLAGPMANLLLALVLATINNSAFSTLISINYYLAIFTLLPIGSFDGTKVLFGSRLLYFFAIITTALSVIFISYFSFFATLVLALIIAVICILSLLYQDKE